MLWRKTQRSEVYWPSQLKAWPLEPNLLGVMSSFAPPSSPTLGKLAFLWLCISDYWLFWSGYEEERHNTCDSLML